MRRRRSNGSFKSSSSTNPHSGRCKTCGAPIWWYRMTSGKFKPPYADQAMTMFHDCGQESEAQTEARRAEEEIEERMGQKYAANNIPIQQFQAEAHSDFDMEAYTLGLQTQIQDLNRANQLQHLVHTMRHQVRELSKGMTHAS